MKKNNTAIRPVVFLDRDGTLNVEAGYIRKLEDLVLIEGAAQSVKRLNDAGIAAILITNQSGAARNFYPESHIKALHKRLQLILAEQGAFLDAIYYCPHLPGDNGSPLAIVCNCRKPATGMIDLVYKKYPQLNRQQSFMVGDKISDVELAVNCQARSILVKTGYGESSLKTLSEKMIQPDFIAQDICQAIDWVLHELHF